VYHEIRELIVWGQLPPGVRIAERAMAERLGVSRTPVRSALHRLQQEGFVASTGNGSDQRLIVAPMTQDDGQELYLMVGHLEGFAARTAASLPPARRKAVVARLRTINRELSAALRGSTDITRIFWGIDFEFHRSFVEGVAGPRLLTAHRAIKPQTERYARAYVSVLLGELPASVKEHDTIIDAIAKGDPDAAQRAVEVNWRNAAARLTRVIAQYGELGSWHTRDSMLRRRAAGR
jgi:DNA-binding GntR family transcriptional regulator